MPELWPLVIVGESTDFQEKPVTGEAPEWEHTLLLRQPGCESVAIDRLRLRRLRRLFLADKLDIWQLIRLASKLRRARTVVAQSEERGYIAALAMALLPGRRNLFIIYHGHRWWTRRNRAFAFLMRRLGFVHFLCLSHSLADHVIKKDHLPPDRVHVTGFAADAEFFRCLSSTERPCVVSAGSASRDYRTLVSAARGLDLGIEIAASSTWYQEELNTSPETAPGNVRFVKCQDYRELRELYSRALFVVVALQDVDFAAGYAVIAEAMAMGKAVIATRTRAPSDLIEDGVSGLYVPAADVSALREAMRLLANDPERARRMGVNARAAVEHRHNLCAYVGRIVDVMEFSGRHV